MLFLLNFFFLQFFCLRIYQHVQIMPYGEELPLCRFGVLWGVVPLTGWSFLPWKKYVYFFGEPEKRGPVPPPRRLTNHAMEGYDGFKPVEVLDLTGYGNAPHNYLAWQYPDSDSGAVLIKFQCGPIQEVGHNGITHEQLISILIDRLRMFQSGQFACAENREAEEHLKNALSVLQQRTRKRITRGVEGRQLV